MVASKMEADIIAEYFKKSKQNLQSEHDSMIQDVKQEISSYKKKAISKAWDISLNQYQVLKHFNNFPNRNITSIRIS